MILTKKLNFNFFILFNTFILGILIEDEKKKPIINIINVGIDSKYSVPNNNKNIGLANKNRPKQIPPYITNPLNNNLL